MITEKAQIYEKPEEIETNLSVYKIGGNYTYGCRRSKSVGYYDSDADKTFFSWNGEGMDVYVSAFDHKTGSFEEKRKITVNNMKKKWDYHNYPVTVKAPNGRMLVFHARHGCSMYQLTAAEPHTIDCPFEKKLISEDMCCYPAPVVCGKDIYLFYSKNDEMSYPYRTLRYIRSRDSGITWEEPVTVIDSQKRDTEKFDEVYLCDATYVKESERIQLTWTMWGGPRGHAGQGRGVFTAYLSLKNGKLYSSFGRCLGDLVDYDEISGECCITIVAPLDREYFPERFTIKMALSAAEPETGLPMVVYAGSDKNYNKNIKCARIRNGGWDTETIVDGVESLKDMRILKNGDIEISYHVDRHVIIKRLHEGEWNDVYIAEMPFEGDTDSIQYTNFFENEPPKLIAMTPQIKLDDRMSNYEGTWPVYILMKENGKPE